MEATDPKGFLGSLFDPSFDELITPRVIKVLYILFMIAIGLFALLFVISAFAQDTAFGVVTLFILAPLGGLLYLILARVYLELIIVIFRIRDAADRIAAK
jgi:uncharacterized protein DUF4282